jgi:hypothetical protein
MRNGSKSLWIQGPGDSDYALVMSSADNTITGAGQVGVVYYIGGTATDAVGYHLDNFTVR